jgi:hypothetical protein
MNHRNSLMFCLAAVAACVAPGDDGDDGTPQAGPVVTEDLGGGVHETIVDATHEEAWTYFDFETRAHVEPADAAADPAWDLGVLRFNVKTNGGTSGTGGATVAILDGVSFDDVIAAPAGGWIEDDAQAPGMGGDAMANTSPGYAFDNWFAYDLMSHTLMPVADRVHVVRTPEGNDFKVMMLGYYDDAGTPGFVRFRWAALP